MPKQDGNIKIVESFITSNKPMSLNNKNIYYNEYSDEVLIRYYQTLIAVRKDKSVRILEGINKYSASTNVLVRLIERIAKEKGCTVTYVKQFAKGSTVKGFVGGVNPEYLLKLSNYQIVGDIIKTLNKDNTEELDLALTYYVDELYDRFDWENDVFEYQSENDQIGYEDLVDIIAIRTNKSKSEIKDIFNSNIAISEKYAKGSTIKGVKQMTKQELLSKYKGKYLDLIIGEDGKHEVIGVSSTPKKGYLSAEEWYDDLYAKGSTVKGGITIHELENRLSEHTQVIDDRTLDSEEIHNWGADNVTEYKKAQNEIDKIKYKGKGWEIYGWYDVSSFDYWMIKQEEQNYIQITIKFKNETVKEEEVDEIADALDSALADADRITNKYNYNPSKFAKGSTVKGNYVPKGYKGQLYDVFAIKNGKWEKLNDEVGGLTKKHAENMVNAINKGDGQNFTKGYSEGYMDKEGVRSFQKYNNGGGVAVSSQSGYVMGTNADEWQNQYALGGGIDDKYKLTLKSWDADIYEDSYEEGEGEHVNSFGEKVNKSFSSGEELLEYISDHILYHNAKKEDYNIMDDGRIVTSVLVDVDNSSASKSEIEEWKKGNGKLYSANYNFYVTLTHEKTPSDEELSKMLGISIYRKGGSVKKYSRVSEMDSVEDTKSHFGYDNESWNELSKEEKIKMRKLAKEHLLLGAKSNESSPYWDYSIGGL